MNTYRVEKAFDQFKTGDEIILNLRQAKYRLLSGHITPLPAETIDEADLSELLTPEPEALHEIDFVAGSQ